MNNSTNKKNFDRKPNGHYLVGMDLSGKTVRGDQYDPSDIIEILKVLDDIDISTLISIPINAEKKMVFPDTDRRGFVTVGYLEGIDLENETLKVCVYSNYTDSFEGKDDIMAHFRVSIKKDGSVRQILGIDLG